MGKKKQEDRSQESGVRSQEEEAAVESAAQGEEEKQEKTGQAKACPTFTLRADVRWQRLALFAVVQMMRGLGLPAEKMRELEAVEREFELWDEV
jgi:hypothetical protein